MIEEFCLKGWIRGLVDFLIIANFHNQIFKSFFMFAPKKKHFSLSPN